MYLENIHGPADVKKLSMAELPALAEEMRQDLLLRASRHGGHFGPNFGMVEATIALHYVFDSPRDKIVYDVSHQSYPHKMLTGRAEAYYSEPHYDDVSGYSNPQESEHDFFEIGHTSTSISLAAGLAKARDLKGEAGNVIVVIGDGSLSGGEALEGLDFAAELQSNFIIIVNDNQMSIAENHGGMYENLAQLRATDGKADCNLFKAMGLDYYYVGAGNDTAALIETFRKVKDCTKPTVVHINTLKGKGYAPAVADKENWHYCAPFHIETGEPLYTAEGEDYSSMTCAHLLAKMKQDPAVVAITSATPTVMGFTADKRTAAGRQFVDVGIAEETAVALSSGIAKNGGKPFYGVYSTFVQRTYDQIAQDVCINNSPVTIAVYLASVFGMNDVTHLGIYDIPLLSNIPNLVYLAPTTAEEYFSMVDWSLEQTEHPVAIRVPCGPVEHGPALTKNWADLNRYEVVRPGARVAIIGLGSFQGLARQAADELEKRTGVKATIINPYYITGLDEALLDQLKADHDVVMTLEDGVLDGGFGEKIARYYGNSEMKVLCRGLQKTFLDRYEAGKVLAENRLTPAQIAEDLAAAL